ncbi:MAG TPA: NADH:flavin oxidoreductase, partial [Clostridium sp.]|nr:NADH:flavin oxidoreductase [Clostridium sp.]
MKIDIFSPVEIGGIQMNNRIIRSATDESMADEFGRPTEKLTKLYSNLAKGEVGGIITGFIAVSEEGKTTMPGMCSLHTDENIESIKKMVDEIHNYKIPIIAQIAHCGRHSVVGKKYNVNKMTQEQLLKMIDDFTETAVRCKKAGFDCVQIHCALGYFLIEVLSLNKNHRKFA